MGKKKKSFYVMQSGSRHETPGLLENQDTWGVLVITTLSAPNGKKVPLSAVFANGEQRLAGNIKPHSGKDDLLLQL